MRISDWSSDVCSSDLMIDTGDFTGIGTKAFASVSYTNYGVPYNPYGEVKKTQFNGRIWQDLGSNGDFIAISGHFNRNRNNFAGSESLEDLLGYYDGTFTKKERFTQYEESGVRSEEHTSELQSLMRNSY